MLAVMARELNGNGGVKRQVFGGGPRLLCLGLLFAVIGCSKGGLYHKLSEKEANEFIVRLNAAGISAEKELEPSDRNPTWKVLVEKERLGAAFQVLDLYGLPRKPGHGIEAVYPPGGLIPGQYEEKAKFLHAMTGELEMTLEAIDGVVDAHVHVVLPEEDVLRDDSKDGTNRAPRPTASILLKYIPDAKDKKPYSDLEIKQLVWRAVEGLQGMDDITVVSKPISPFVVEAAAGDGSVGATGMSFEQCKETYKEKLADNTELVSLGTFKIARDSYRGVVIGGAVLGVVVLILLVLWFVAFFQAATLKRKLAALQKRRKS